MKSPTKNNGAAYSLLALLTAICALLVNTTKKWGANPTAATIEVSILLFLFWAVASVSGFFYFQKGCRKQDAKLYKLFIWSTLLGLVVSRLSVLLKTSQGGLGLFATSFLLWLLAFSTLLLLAYVPNLGHKRANLLAGISVAANVSSTVLLCIAGPSAKSDLLDGATKILLSLLLATIVKAKYEDKDARGTI